MIKVIAMAIVTLMLVLLFKSTRPQFAMLVCLAGCLMIFAFSLTKFQSLLVMMNKLQQYVSINSEYITILLKIIGITYVTEFASDLCKDAGYFSISSQVELAGKLCIIGFSMPVLLAILNTINTMIIG